MPDSTKFTKAEAIAARRENIEWTQGSLRQFNRGPGPIASIRRKCLDCCAWQPGEVARCHLTNCALWPYRLGTDPFHKQWVDPPVKGSSDD